MSKGNIEESQSLYLGIDVGTSGVRASCVDGAGAVVAAAEVSQSISDGDVLRQPSMWKRNTILALQKLAQDVPFANIAGLSVDGQSGTMLICEPDGQLFEDSSLLYNDAPGAESQRALTEAIGKTPAALARGLELWWLCGKPGAFRLVHQADWIAGQLSGNFDVSDENNALKTGYAPAQHAWSFTASSLAQLGPALPAVRPAGSPTGLATTEVAARLGLRSKCKVVAGSTDGMAGFIAASGLSDFAPGQAVTSLGTTMVVKIVSGNEIESSAHGIYSHRLLGSWVAGGASNCGAGALLQFFSLDQLEKLSRLIDPSQPSELDYYPLTAKGERFPVNDPQLVSRTEPRPADDAMFLAGLLESIARVERRSYEAIAAMGGTYPHTVKTVGGGSRNKVWSQIRQRVLGVEVSRAAQVEAAYGAALLARHGAHRP